MEDPSAASTSSPKKEKEHKMPSLFHFIWQPRKQRVQERAKTVARRMSFNGTTSDQTTPPTRSDTNKTTVSDPGHHPPHLNRAQQKSLKRQQKANESKTSSLSGSGPLSPSHHHHHRNNNSAEFGHGPEHHQGSPLVGLDARFGYLEHSGRALHLGAFISKSLSSSFIHSSHPPLRP